jgi:integrase
VRQLLGTWKAHQRKRLAAEEIEPRSFKAYGHSVRRLANAESRHQIGDVAIEDVRSSTLEDYALARAEQGHAHKTINDDIAVFLMAWKWGRKRELGPLRHLEPDLLKPKPVRPTRTPSREELLTLIEVLPLRYALLVRLMYATGSRVGEIAAMEWRDVDLARRSLRLGVYVGNRKTGERTAAIHPEVAEVLRAWRDREADPVTRSRPIAPEVRARWVLGVRPASAVSRLMKLLPDACAMVAERLKLSGEDQRFTSHAIRRWCATEMARSKVPIKTASAQQGHSEEMNAVYQQPTFEDQDEAVSAARLGVVIAFRSGTG